jgi:hypothetical protein
MEKPVLQVHVSHRRYITSSSLNPDVAPSRIAPYQSPCAISRSLETSVMLAFHDLHRACEEAPQPKPDSLDIKLQAVGGAKNPLTTVLQVVADRPSRWRVSETREIC